FFAFGIVARIVFMTPLHKLYERFKVVQLIVVGLFLSVVGMVILSVAAMFGSNVYVMIIYGFGFAFLFPSMNKVIADASSKVDRGKAYGVFYAFFSLGAVVGSAASGLFAEILGLPFLVCALIMFLSVASIILIQK